MIDISFSAADVKKLCSSGLTALPEENQLQIIEALKADGKGGEFHGDAERLREYWAHGEGAGKIRWGEPGDFARCVSHLGKYIENPEGYCQLRHHDALGYYTATHARMEGKKNSQPEPTGTFQPDGYYNSASSIDVSASAEKRSWDPAKHPRGYRGEFISTTDTMALPDLSHPEPGVKNLSSKGRPDGKGTPDDPIDVQGNIDRALLLLAQGKHVRLNQPDEVTLIASKVNKLGADFKARGKDMPAIDFGKLTLTGTNLFTAQAKGIPRARMPQLSGIAQPGTPAAEIAGGAGKMVDLGEQFRQDLKSHGVKVTDEMVPASHLRATQTQLKGSSVAGIAQAWLDGVPGVLKMMKEPIWVTRDNYVVDGHHRWAAEMVLDTMDGHLGDVTMEVHKVDMDIGATLAYANEYAGKMGIPQQGLEGNATLVQKEMVTLTTAELADLIKVGPKGYVHGWRFVGTPVLGTDVEHPELGRGHVTGHEEGKVNVRFPATGEDKTFPMSKPVEGEPQGPARLEPASPDAISSEGMKTLAYVNAQSKTYTDAQVEALQGQINKLRAELHAESHKEKRMTMVIHFASVAAAIGLAFVTGGMSLALLGPLLVEKTPEIGRITAEYLHARRGHTEHVLTPLKRGEKSAQSAQDKVISALTEIFTKTGADEADARKLSALIVAKAAKASAAGRFPGDDGFLTDDDVKSILSSMDSDQVSMKASDLVWLVK